MIKLLLSFVVFIFCMPVFSNDLIGTKWAMTGQECRDPDLSRSSRRSMEIEGLRQASMSFGTNEVYMEMTNTRGESANVSAPYRIDGDEITINGQRKTLSVFKQERRLLILGTDSETIHRCCNVLCLEGLREYRESYNEGWREKTWEEKLEEEGWDEEWLAEKGTEECEELKDRCLDENQFVYVMGKVSGGDE